jgi:hypothetical protein
MLLATAQHFCGIAAEALNARWSKVVEKAVLLDL